MALRITITRQQLQAFVQELKREHEEFFRRHKEKTEAIEKERIARKLQKSKTRNSE